MNASGIIVDGTYDFRLVCLSYIVAVIAAYAALDLAGRVTASQGLARRVWLIGGAAAMGLGIWTMHFIGMLAFQLPIPMSYTAPLVVFSLLIAVASSGLALYIASRPTLGNSQLLLGGLFMGGGIAAMHYVGMAAMVIPGTISYNPFWFVGSIVVAVAASLAALWLAFHLRTSSITTRRWLRLKIGSALLMGAAVVGMHYTGMQAAIFSTSHMTEPAMASDMAEMSLFGLLLGVAVLVILGFVLLSALVDQRFSTQTATFESLFLHSTDAIYALDLNGALQRANPAGLQLIGLTMSMPFAQALHELIAPEERELFSSQFARAVQGESQQGDYGLLPNLERRLVGHVAMVPIIISNQIIGVFCIIQDITAQREAGNALRQQRDLYERLLLGISDLGEGVIVVENFRITFANDAFCRICGYTQKELYTLASTELLIPAPDRELVNQHIRELNRGISSSGRFETGLQHKQGQRIPVEVAFQVVQDLRGVQWVILFRDISERKLAEAELARAAAELERSARVATELAIVADAANQAKSAFLATMSHEIRTPMNGVIGMTGLLLDTRLTAEQFEFVETIRTSGEALLTIINDILDFSKIESGKMELEQHPFDVRDCIESALDLLAPRASEKELDLAYLIDQDVPATVVGDVTRLRQILVNLLGNALKFTEQGEVVVTMHVEDSSQQEPLLHIAVRDTGIGIPPERMDRLFRSFSQADTSTTRQYGGTGLGLAISKRLSELMGGTMWVESVPQQGSTFHVTFRAAVAPSQPRLYLRGAIPELNGKHLLVVDDNATNRRILTLQAENWGMNVSAVAGATEALALIERGEPFDIAILDMQMPEMDGVQLAGVIRQYRPARQLPLILLTSFGRRAEDSATGLFALSLAKPVKASQLYDALVQIFVQTSLPERRMLQQPAFDREMAKRLPLRILLAEDNAINQKVALRILERLGYRADVAGNGLEVLDALARQHYDLVLMDVHMPELDGLETTRRIRQDFSLEPQPYIIAMTANAIQGDREECLAAGMDNYISKPVRVEMLIQALETLMPESQVQPDPVEASHNQLLPVLDRTVMNRLQADLGDGGPALLIELIDIFLAETPQRFDEMQEALQNSDAKLLERAAHTLKATSTLLGLRQLAAYCTELEHHAALQQVEDCSRLLQATGQCYRETEQALRALRIELPVDSLT